MCNRCGSSNHKDPDWYQKAKAAKRKAERYQEKKAQKEAEKAAAARQPSCPSAHGRPWSPLFWPRRARQRRPSLALRDAQLQRPGDRRPLGRARARTVPPGRLGLLGPVDAHSDDPEQRLLQPAAQRAVDDQAVGRADAVRGPVGQADDAAVRPGARAGLCKGDITARHRRPMVQPQR